MSVCGFHPGTHIYNIFPDAGKSTIGGHLMYLTGMVDKRTLEKYEREAKEKNRETWLVDANLLNK
jgi:translation elongation factor EF-1alpha